jgi:DNA-binding beta-propeller fold protein YncE
MRIRHNAHRSGGGEGRRGRRALVTLALGALIALAGCGGGSTGPGSPASRLVPGDTGRLTLPGDPPGGYRVPPLLDPRNVYAADRRGNFSPVVARFRPLVYVPNSGSSTVDEIDPTTYGIVRQFPVGELPQHVVPSYDLRTLWVTNDLGNSLTPIDPTTGIPGRPVAVDDPYNLYFSPDGRYAIVMAEQRRRIDFRDAHTMKLHHELPIPGCAGLNHADFTADGRYMLVSCEFGAAMVLVDVAAERVVRTLPLPAGASPQDVKLSPDGRLFFVADLTYGGVWEIAPFPLQRLGLIRTGAGAHGLYPSRDATQLYVSNRGAGTVSVISFQTQRVVATWSIPGGSPDMGGVSASGHVLWLSGRYDAAVYAIDTANGRLIRRIPVGSQPHGLCVYPQPGRYSLGHTQLMR